MIIQARLEDRGRDDHIKTLFRSFPRKTRARQILDWYKAHPGEWERMHPAEPRRSRR